MPPQEVLAARFLFLQTKSTFENLFKNSLLKFVFYRYLLYFVEYKMYDIAIVGYGPTGMVLAALLGRMGHKVIVLERYTGLYNLPRAACFDDETMRTFQKIGLAEDILKGAVAQHNYDWVNATGDVLVNIEYANQAPGGWAALYMMFQPHIENVLDKLDKSLESVEIRQGATVNHVAQDEEGVTLGATTVDGVAVSVRARYVVGADGGNGFLSRIVSSHADDYNFQENWLVCDFRMLRAVPDLPSFRQVCDPVQPTSIVRIGPDHHRMSFMLKEGETKEEAIKPDSVWQRVSRYLTPQDAELVRVVNYVFMSRIADQWRKGRIMLAGDSAHQMPPFLGQGMCSGIRDSHNLAWKLDLILKNKCSADILDTYQPEREPHVRFITEKAIELGRVQTMRDFEKVKIRDEQFLALRRSSQKPDKIKFPALHGGLIANNGSFFPQAYVAESENSVLFDDYAKNGWLVVSWGREEIPELSIEAERILSILEAQKITFNVSSTKGVIKDESESYKKWFDENDCTFAIIRPDWYVYGTAQNITGLQELIAGLGKNIS